MSFFLRDYTPDPVAFSIFGIDIMWYGILVGLGMLIASTVSYKRAPKHEIKSDKILDILIICLPAGIIGARLYYVAFNFGDYSGDFLKIVNIRLGGLAIHGGLIVGFLACFLLCLLWNMRPLNVFDVFAPGIALGQSIGRWGNYFNSEAHGGATSLPWGIPVGGEMVHPTFLYESVWCFILFFILIAIDNRRTFMGQTFFSYGMLYSFERFFVEALRTDSLMLGVFKQAQIMSATVFVICLLALIIIGRTERTKGKIFY